MKLQPLFDRPLPPTPWLDSGKIPWQEESFSSRMLQEHLSDSHDLASRRAEGIQHQVQWIHDELLQATATQIVDLGCGPGLYVHALAQAGHLARGIDFSPASISYAQDKAAEEGLPCEFVQADVLEAPLGEDNGMIMMLFGEFQTFPPEQAKALLSRVYGALKTGGMLLLELQRYEAVRALAEQPRHWHTASQGGLFSADPYLCLKETFWSGEHHAAVERYFIVDSIRQEFSSCTSTTQAYTEEAFCQLLESCGFAGIQEHDVWGDGADFACWSALKGLE